ncbi:MAG: hypothetical protein QG670_674 [Thermoproteota archaeon]|nr:hypothetical protein [Thermoproteota archaeon]
MVSLSEAKKRNKECVEQILKECEYEIKSAMSQETFNPIGVYDEANVIDGTVVDFCVICECPSTDFRELKGRSSPKISVNEKLGRLKKLNRLLKKCFGDNAPALKAHAN